MHNEDDTFRRLTRISHEELQAQLNAIDYNKINRVETEELLRARDDIVVKSGWTWTEFHMEWIRKTK